MAKSMVASPAWTQAAQAGDVASLRQLDAQLPRGAGPAFTSRGADPLMVACARCQWEAAMELTRLRPEWATAPPRIRNPDGRNFLHLAAAKIPVDVLEVLAMAAPWARSAEDRHGTLPETEAALMGNLDAALWLKIAREGEPSDPSLDAQTFVFACQSMGSLEQAELFAKGVDFSGGASSRFPFREAAKSPLGEELVFWIARKAKQARPKDEFQAIAAYESRAANAICELLSGAPKDELSLGSLALRLWADLDLQSQAARDQLMGQGQYHNQKNNFQRKGFDSAEDFLAQALRFAVSQSAEGAFSRGRLGPRL